MDCVDCHNRPTHIFRAPDRSVDLALADSHIDPSLPYIKQQSVAALPRLTRQPAGDARNRQALCAAFIGRATLRCTQPSSGRSRVPSRICRALMTDYFFPSMKVRWDTYATNDTHFYSVGCFRCHDGQHKSVDGSLISSDCGTCHTILGQGKAGSVQYATGPQGLPFKHPVDVGGIWASQPCSSCHTGGSL